MNTAEWALIVAIGSLSVSALVAYLTLIRKGAIRMTQPTVIYFGADAGSLDTQSRAPKVFLRTLLYSTAKRGNVVSTLYVRLTRAESVQTFNIWVNGDKELSRGSGLFVGEQGVVTNHHFLPPKDGTEYRFLPGNYKVELFATSVEHATPQRLWLTHLELTPRMAEHIQVEPIGGVYFDWQPNAKAYHAQVG